MNARKAFREVDKPILVVSIDDKHVASSVTAYRCMDTGITVLCNSLPNPYSPITGGKMKLLSSASLQLKKKHAVTDIGNCAGCGCQYRIGTELASSLVESGSEFKCLVCASDVVIEAEDTVPTDVDDSSNDDEDIEIIEDDPVIPQDDTEETEDEDIEATIKSLSEENPDDSEEMDDSGDESEDTDLVTDDTDDSGDASDDSDPGIDMDSSDINIDSDSADLTDVTEDTEAPTDVVDEPSDEEEEDLPEDDAGCKKPVKNKAGIQNKSASFNPLKALSGLIGSNDSELSIVAESPSTSYVFFRRKPIATLSFEKASADIKKLWHENARLKKALLAAMETDVDKELADNFGFEPITIEFTPEQYLNQEKEKIVSSLKKSFKKRFNSMYDDYRQCVSIAAVGINKGFFKEVENPLRVKLHEELSKYGVYHPNKIIDQVLEASGEALFQTVLAKAQSLMETDKVARNDMAKFIEEATFQHQHNNEGSETINRLSTPAVITKETANASNVITSNKFTGLAKSLRRAAS